jgi:hypothetical protein
MDQFSSSYGLASSIARSLRSLASFCWSARSELQSRLESAKRQNCELLADADRLPTRFRTRVWSAASAN